MGIVSANQFDLNPRIGEQFARGRAASQQFRINEQVAAGAQEDRALAAEQEAARKRSQAQLGQFSAKALAGDEAALTRVAQEDPQKAMNIQNFLSKQSDAEREEFRRENEAMTRVALQAKMLPPEQRRPFIQQQRDRAAAEGRSTERTDRALQGTDEELAQAIEFQANEGRNIEDVAKQVFGGVGGASTKAFAPITDPSTGRIGVPTFNPDTGKAGFQFIEGAPTQETPEQKRVAELKRKQEEADIDISKSEKKETQKSRISRASKIREEISTRNRDAARSGRTLSQALKLASNATQGLTGAAKLQLSRLIPGIDATDEAALDATLKQLALEQLQQFKGPTTNFEFGVTQSIAGSLGNSKEANIARVKSLDRARWFNQRELQQFNKHVNQGGEPDNFSFDFGEKIKTKKGPFSLQNLQDTAVNQNMTIDEVIARLNK